MFTRSAAIIAAALAAVVVRTAVAVPPVLAAVAVGTSVADVLALAAVAVGAIDLDRLLELELPPAENNRETNQRRHQHQLTDNPSLEIGWLVLVVSLGCLTAIPSGMPRRTR